MKKRCLAHKLILLLLIIAAPVNELIAGGNDGDTSSKIRLLLISGSNNHEWKETSPILESVFTDAGCFSVDVTENPDTLCYDDFSTYDAVVSNWNSWPDNDVRWPLDAEDGLLKFVKNGGGLVFFHASSSVFYAWPEFKQISTGAWIENTKHGKPGMVHVEINESDHPITKGINGFIVFDELWENAEKNPDFKVLGTAWSEQCEEKQPAIMVAEVEEGRIFHTILGHDVRAIRNAGLNTLLLRGTEWAATGKVSKNTSMKRP